MCSSSSSISKYIPPTQDNIEPAVNLAIDNPKRPSGRRKFKETRHPVYRGIRLRGPEKWGCEVREPKKKSRIWLGTFPTAVMAARAHDVAAIALKGSSACLNFADSAWRLPVPASTDPKDIKKTAAEAAKLFRPEEDIAPPTEETVLPDMADAEFNGPMMSPPLFLDEESMSWLHRLMDDTHGG